MRIQCDVCEKAPATVICCADEAALCAACDIEIHAANKLASKHQRLMLQSLSTKLPRCDICQAVDISPLRRVNQAIYLLTTSARESAFRNIKTIAECLADELINAAKGSSNSYAIKKKDEI